MTAYTITPVGRHGPDENRTRLVHGPSLRDSLPRQELARRLVAQEEELQRLRRQLVVAQAAARHVDRLRWRMDTEAALRFAVQERMHKVALALAVIEGTCPSAREAVEAARDEIWGLGDV